MTGPACDECQPDGHSVRYSNCELIVDVNCRNCGRPGSFELTPDLVQWDAEEGAQLAGMAFGVDGYNDALGQDLEVPDPCGHHCRNCPRCGY